MPTGRFPKTVFRFSLLATLFLVGGEYVAAQTGCSFTISGRILSEHDGEQLGYANVYLIDERVGVQADSSGYFEVNNVCGGAQVLRFSHIGCDAQEIEMLLRGDTTLTVFLHHHDNFTETVTVSSAASAEYTRELDRQAVATLGDVLERTAGVSSLRSGTAAAKPVYDGVFGNRLSLQNNGIAQSGQQWGNDHAPEIDPWVAAYVRVVEGVEALKYAGPTVAATVLIEPAPLRENESPSGTLAYGFQSNGLGNTLNARLTAGGRTAYRLSATGKIRGDQRAPDYVLTNTGRQEINAALQLAHFHNQRWTSRLYYSIFNANIGVLRGSHIGNLTDLQDAIGREEPFFTQPDISFDINSPRQAVQHHLLKLETEFRPNEDHRLTLRYGGQLNNRKEFDVRRGDRDNIPALSLRQWSHLVEGAWHHELAPDRHLDANLQYEFVLNDNVPGTGIFPLIPDYNANRASAYLAYHEEGDRWQYHAGLRVDRQFYEAITITPDPPFRIERFEHRFNTLGASAEGNYRITGRSSLRLGVTLRERAPQINELYSRGLHQGVSGIEEGDNSLQPERSLKVTGGWRYASNSLIVNASAFVQPVRDYIFLEPQPEFRLTIRGAFPLFLYRAGDALLYGSTLTTFWQPNDRWEVDGRLAIVRGRNRTEDSPLVYMPADNLRLGVKYRTGSQPRGWQLSLSALLVDRQTRLDAEQDFLPPPPGYALLEAGLEKEWGLPVKNPSAPGRTERTLHLRLGAQNLLNSTYRDYLDRQRYFADAPGRNVELRLSYEW
ncbi:TonB-dependent receptor [Lewinella sp. W8]|uniref:TonB-dependent receptor n=1 Tax=Lewinella sp. W8 TaxID=2528208 RepID=UPI001564B9D1|nr:TonB-dependent receptor [Lewinella sp. W8]